MGDSHSLQDKSYMLHALRLAERGLGRTWPNPSVGALILKDGVIVGTGVTAPGGRPHAETQALAQAGAKAVGATLYVTLEPCAHQGRTPPCTDAIIAAGIARVVVACEDPDPRVSGKGIAQLREADIEVVQDICRPQARSLNEGFFSVIEKGRPFVTLKIATSLDGKIATGSGESKWITGEGSRRKVHALRARHDAILTGIGTVLYDDPHLTCRLPGCEDRSPQRVLLDSTLRLPAAARLLPAWIFTSERAFQDKGKVNRLVQKGAELFTVAETAARLSLEETLRKLAALGITRLLVEAGSALASELMRQDFVDRLYWFRAPLLIGDKGIPALLGPSEEMPLAQMPRLRLEKTERYGPDRLEIYDRA